MKLINVWNTTKNVLAVYFITINIAVIVLVILLLSHKFSLNIELGCFATTTENVSIQKIPVNFQLTKDIFFSGTTDVTMPKDIILPVKVYMNIPLDIINITNKKKPVHIDIK
ncbi:MAG: hypothetical protein A2015_05785 [Spirochaetes bacterium GWF1_31_7]|nr:MAG: hypothetical protein A2Y30_00195 [Spirochaetes bacterium GWE1_32_154]OHD47201.1 MAG: hypothetical protein A2Y29_10780 [Spirochaetes bacterium GWE2_31_10]OHD48934.1 MAG: hypothetical protein A2015_05785 [Spirochaetes bacterium GWF1_31_7]OHD74689.1 MAG: hypothetical protein A2355_03345 [Spirochaetes bacterium RIFOXYB1_FULL_32_8]HBD92591.1 hypothetical protein [Spirochaetia bacterium]